jgi:hypothetical protein
MLRGAKFSGCGNYRYSLWRIWDESKSTAMCIGLNPSTGNHETDDPTIRQLIDRLGFLGYGGFYMCNLYGLISSKPGKLFEVSDSQGDNIEWLQNIGQRVDEVIFCWGSFKRIEYRAKTAIEMFPNAKCFGRSKNGSPTHPMALMWGGIKIEKTRLEPYSESKIQAPYPFLKGSD